MLTIQDVEKIVDVKLRELAPRFRIGTVATVSGDATVGYSVTVYLDNDTAHPTAPVRCYRHYTPTVGDRVEILWQNGQPWRAMGKVN